MLTVGELIKFIEEYNIDLDSPIYVERVEDVYYDKHCRETLDFECDEFPGQKDRYREVFRRCKKKDDSRLFLNLHY